MKTLIMKKLTMFLFLIFLSVSGTQAFALSPGVYTFSGTVTLEAIFATGGTGSFVVIGTAPFCMEELTVDPADGDGIQTITGSDDPDAGYGVSIPTITMIVDEIDLYATGQITGWIDTNGGNVDATVRTWGNNQPIGPPGWWTEITSPSGPANTVVMTIPLNSQILTPPPPPISYGDPAATSFTAIAEFNNAHGLTSDSRSGYPLTGSSLKIVSPDAHFKGGLVLLDTISFTTFEGVFSEDLCPLVDVDSDGVLDYEDNCPTISNPDQADSDGNGVGDACQNPYVCIDIDLDGFGAPASPSCPYARFDCNDLDPSVNPLMTEILENGIDENCDGLACFIATAAFGTELDGRIEVLRSFRDTYLIDNPVGRAFVTGYYKYSPPVANCIAEHRWLKTLVRTLLLPVIGLASLFV